MKILKIFKIGLDGENDKEREEKVNILKRKREKRKEMKREVRGGKKRREEILKR